MKLKNIFKSPLKILWENVRRDYKEMSEEELKEQLNLLKKFIRDAMYGDWELRPEEIDEVLELTFGTHKQLILVGRLE